MKKSIALPRKVLRKVVLYTASYYCWNQWPENDNDVWEFFLKGLRKFYKEEKYVSRLHGKEEDEAVR